MTYMITSDSAAEDAAALRYALEFASVKHSAHSTALRALADSIEEQVKPAIEEPTEFGSIVHASDKEGRTFNAVRVYEGAKKPWNSGTAWYGWWELNVHEVLRVGIGEDRDVAPEETSDYIYGVHDTISAVRRKLQALRDEAITAERQNAYDKAIKAMEAL